MRDPVVDPDRRRFMRLAIAAPLVFAAGLKLRWPAEAESSVVPPEPRTLAPTPECGDDDEPTPPTTEGPFFKPRSPLRASLIERGVVGTRLVVSGKVFSSGCHPLAGALIDFWQADGEGEYDNVGFKLRGHQFTDARGQWRLETVVPGLYPGRTRHLHVKVQARNGRPLTTQLFFPGEARNRRDGIFDPELLVALRETGAVREGRFHFVLNAPSSS
jgi:protocatechuate 3,4-dioxygenase beta subunit